MRHRTTSRPVATRAALLRSGWFGGLCLWLSLFATLTPAPAVAQEDGNAPARQVTLFGVIATPTDLRIDPRLAKIEPQLRKLLPNHGFRLLDVRGKRLSAGQTLNCDLGGGFTASTTLVSPADENGKVLLLVSVLQNRMLLLENRVNTPPNQLFFCDKLLPDGSRLLIGIGAR